MTEEIKTESLAFLVESLGLDRLRDLENPTLEQIQNELDFLENQPLAPEITESENLSTSVLTGAPYQSQPVASSGDGR